MPQVLALFVKGKPKRGPMIPLDSAEVVVGQGLKGGRHGRPFGKRQVLIMPAEVLDAFDLPPGSVRENITTRGIDVMALQLGDRLRIGEVVLEATGECTPCDMLEEIRPGLKMSMVGQRGMLFRVLAGGSIRLGDAIQVISAAPASV